MTFTRICCDPIHFPGFAILREGLLKAPRIGSVRRDHKSNQDRPAVKRFLIEEFATSILEFTDGGLAQGPAFAIGEIQAPLVRLWIVET